MATGPEDRIRASDAEREEYAKILRAAMTEGRLTLQEGEERLASVYAAKYRDELAPLTTDLPEGGRKALYDTPEARAEHRRHSQRALTGHAGFLVVIGAVLVTLWALSGAHFFWPIIPLVFLWFGFLRHLAWRRWTRGYTYRGGWGRGPWGQGGHWARGWDRGEADRSDAGWRR
jgi:hypothetical protein